MIVYPFVVVGPIGRRYEAPGEESIHISIDSVTRWGLYHFNGRAGKFLIAQMVDGKPALVIASYQTTEEQAALKKIKQNIPPDRTRTPPGYIFWSPTQALQNPPPDILLEIGRAYLAAPDVSHTKAAKNLYALYSEWTSMLFGLLCVDVEFTERDPYPSSEAMRDEVLETCQMRIFSGGNDHPLLSPESNLQGRAVHDLLAHLVCGCSFTGTGEFNAFEAQAAIYPIECRRLLFAEIVGQTGAYLVNNGVNVAQKVVFLSEDMEDAARSLRKKFKKGLTLAGAIEAGLVQPEIVKVAAQTGYSARYVYGVLERQAEATPESVRKNPGWSKKDTPAWAKWL